MVIIHGGPLPDYMRPGLSIVFVGFNPGRRSAAIGHHYAGRTNQFWRLLHDSGLTPIRLSPEEDYRVLDFGMGLTNIVARPTPSSSDLTQKDYTVGKPILEAKLLAYRPAWVCFNGKLIYDRITGRINRLGAQTDWFAGCRVFVTPSSSAANAGIPYTAKLNYFQQLARAAAE